jgi:hypothetical protein
MSEIEVYEIDDQFDPLQDGGPDNKADGEQQPYDYLPPIPDAELSRVPKKVLLTPEERIGNMIAGMPGQKQRILHAISVCTSAPKRLDEITAELDKAFPVQVSVYSCAQVVKLLEAAGALVSREIEAVRSAAAPALLYDKAPTGDCLAVASPPVYEYSATQDGLNVLEAYTGESHLVAVLTEEGRYLPLYRRILEMVSARGGCPTKELDAAIDIDPLCEQPRRFCGYFLDRLEEAGAVKWQDAWVSTKSGTKMLESKLFAHEERS